MTLRHLKIFTYVCEAESISKAAIKLNIAQPAVSQAIKELENYYNVVLFERINQRLKITSAGNDLYFKAKGVLDSFDDFEEIAGSKAMNPELKIGATLTIANSFLLKIMDYIKKHHNNVRPYIYVNNSNEIVSGVANGFLDFGFVESEVNNNIINSSELYQDELVLVCGTDFKCESTIKIEDLGSLPLLLREKGATSRDYIESLCRKEYITMNIIMESISNNAIINMVIANYGLAILPRVIVKNHLKNKKIKEINIENIKLNRSTMIIWHKNKKFLNEQETIFNYCTKIKI